LVASENSGVQNSLLHHILKDGSVLQRHVFLSLKNQATGSLSFPAFVSYSIFGTINRKPKHGAKQSTRISPRRNSKLEQAYQHTKERYAGVGLDSPPRARGRNTMTTMKSTLAHGSPAK
jgi:hypothetical protein